VRRSLIIDNLDLALAECDFLLNNGYTKSGNWSLAQICCHLRRTIEKNREGYPLWMAVAGYPLRPILRWFLLPRLLRGDSPSGVKTAGTFVPGDDLDDVNEVENFRQCVVGFMASDEPLHPHPGFGSMSKEKFGHFHAAHAAHHLSFLHPIRLEENTLPNSS